MESETTTLTDAQKAEMKATFDEWEAEYREDYCEVVYEDESVIVLRDLAGYELTEWADEFDMPREKLAGFMHHEARKYADRTELGGDMWATHDPVVFFK